MTRNFLLIASVLRPYFETRKFPILHEIIDGYFISITKKLYQVTTRVLLKVATNALHLHVGV